MVPHIPFEGTIIIHHIFAHTIYKAYNDIALEEVLNWIQLLQKLLKNMRHTGLPDVGNWEKLWQKQISKWWERELSIFSKLKYIIRRCQRHNGDRGWGHHLYVLGKTSMKKNVFFRASPEWGAGSTHARIFGPFSRSAFLVNKKSLFLQKCQYIELLTVF